MGTRDRIIEAALKVVNDLGPNRLTLEEAARAAGVSKGGVLYHFPCKDALLSGMLDHMLDLVHARQTEIYLSLPAEPYRWTRAWVLARIGPTAVRHGPVEAAIVAASALNPALLEPARRRIAEWEATAVAEAPDPVRAAVVTLAVDGLWLNTLLGLGGSTPSCKTEILDHLLSMLSDSKGT